MNITSKVNKVGKNTKSLKTTIPESVCEVLGLSDKDQLEWRFWMMGERGPKRIWILKTRFDQEDDHF